MKYHVLINKKINLLILLSKSSSKVGVSQQIQRHITYTPIPKSQ